MNVFEWSVLGAIIFLSSLLLLGMPHGAIDHFIYFRLHNRKMTWAALVVFCAAYLGLSGVMFGLWLASPIAGIWGLILLTWWHWGEGDLIYEEAGGRRPGVIFSIWRGGLPMVVPVLFHPEAYVRVLEGALRVTGGSELSLWVDWIGAVEARLVLGAGMVLLASLNWFFLLKLTLKARDRLRFAIEDFILLLVFLVLDPLMSVGIYFMFWHSIRHIRVTADVLGDNSGTEKKVRWALFYKRALPFTLGGIAFLILYHQFTNQNFSDVFSLVGSYLIILWALTWPHAIICDGIRRWNNLRKL